MKALKRSSKTIYIVSYALEVSVNGVICMFVVGMGRLIAVHSIRGFKAHGSVHRRQFVYRGFFRFL